MAGCKRFVVGLTGGIGSGKSAVAERFAELGADIVDTDAIAHALTAPGGAAMPAIAGSFGAGVVAADGRLDRAAMRERVFGDAALRTRLEAILHPLIREEALRQLAGGQGAYAVLAVPLLFEKGGYLELVDRTLVVDCPEETQLARVMARSSLPADAVRAIMAAQLPRAERTARADDVIDNSGGLDKLALQVAAKHRYYLACLARADCPPSTTAPTDPAQ